MLMQIIVSTAALFYPWAKDIYLPNLNFERLIASRILRGSGKGISRPITTIATTAVAVGMALMILSIAVLKGFQTEIRNKVVGFGSHIQVISLHDQFSKESKKVIANQSFVADLAAAKGVAHVQNFALKPGIVETDEGLQGCIIKGIDEGYDWTFFEDKIIRGNSLKGETGDLSKLILISSRQASRMKVDTGDRITAYFVQSEQDIKPRPFTIHGIYETGMEEFDKQYVFVDITQVQKVSGWGLEAQIKHEITEEGVSFEALGFGGDTRHIFDWGSTSIRGKGPHEIAPTADTTLTLIVSNETMTLPDTAWLDVSKTVSGYEAILHTAGGSWRNYVGGFEVLLDDYDDLFQTDDILLDAIPHNMQTRVVTDQYPEIFNWLEMLDLNVIIIISLMIFISVINMTSALLIIILERTRMIGLLKALGTQNSSLVRIFLRNAGAVIGIGLLVGNVIGIGLAWLQKSYGVIKLDPVNYFVETAPIQLDFTSFILLDLLTLLICVLLLILPSLYVGTISPVRAIRFD